MRVTKRQVEAAKYEGGDVVSKHRDVRWDEELAGFGVRVYPSGRKAYVVSYRVQGRKRLLTLGDVHVLSRGRRAGDGAPEARTSRARRRSAR
jgi:hypothetical protein